jgi:hypothetical protein
LIADSSGGLAFAYPLSATIPAQASDKRGLVLLRFSRGNWKADTLWTPEPVAYVSLAAGLAVGTWDVLYQMRIGSVAMRAPGSLFLAAFDGKWETSPPRILGQTGSLNWPSVFRMGVDLFVTWWETSGASGDSKNDSIKWVALLDSATLVAASAPVVARDANEFVVAKLAEGKAIWAVRDRNSTARVRLAYAEMTGITSLGSINVPNESYPHVIAVDDHRFLLLTAKLGKVAGEPAVQQMLTAVSIRCE